MRSPGWRVPVPLQAGDHTAETREWIRRKLLIREFFSRRVAVFADVKRDDVQKEFERRSSSPDNGAN